MERAISSSILLICGVLPLLVILIGFGVAAMMLYWHVGLKGTVVTLSVTTVMASLAFLMMLLSFGVWLPDVVGGQQRVLAQETLRNDVTAQVIQYWNYADFYNTELQLVYNDMILRSCLLDADDVVHFDAELEITKDKITVHYSNNTQDVMWLTASEQMPERAIFEICPHTPN